MKLLAWVFVLGVLAWSSIGLASGGKALLVPALPVAKIEKPEALPYWRRCVTGRRCARAVLPRIFGSQWRSAYRVAHCETGGTFYNRALGAAGERGIFQIHSVHWGWLDESRLFDIRYNSRIAYRISKAGRDWSAWTCQP
jgi:hypothetical protein